MKTGDSNIILKNIKPAKRYSKALMEVAGDTNTDYAVIENDLSLVIKTLNENFDMNNFMMCPVIPKNDKIDIIKQIFKNKISDIMLDFFYTLISNDRFNLINEIYKGFRAEVDLINNILNVQVYSVIELDEGLKLKLTKKLESKLERKINPYFAMDDSIIGGLVIKIQDTVIDLSIKNKIENLKRR